MLIKNEFPAIPIIEQIHITSMHSLFKIHYECGFEFPGETHDFWECLYILDGELCVSLLTNVSIICRRVNLFFTNH